MPYLPSAELPKTDRDTPREEPPDQSGPAEDPAASHTQQIRQDLAALLRAALAKDRKVAEAQGQQLRRDTEEMLTELRAAVDHREVAGGLVGLTAGEVLGGAMGGAAGAVVGGPVGAVLGAEVGAFVAGTLGLKFGTDAVQDYVGQPDDEPALASDAVSPRDVSQLRRAGNGRYGRTIGLASGASVGKVVGGARGSLIGGVLGEAVGSRADAAAAERAAAPALSKTADGGFAGWLDRFGKNAAGEAATVLVAGTIGSVFGPGGRALGRRLGLIVGTRIAWENLNAPSTRPEGTTNTSAGPAPAEDKPRLADLPVVVYDVIGEPDISKRGIAPEPGETIPSEGGR
jgi:hypothetical protein